MKFKINYYNIFPSKMDFKEYSEEIEAKNKLEARLIFKEKKPNAMVSDIFEVIERRSKNV